MSCPWCKSEDLVKFEVNADMIHVVCKSCNEEWVE